MTVFQNDTYAVADLLALRADTVATLTDNGLVVTGNGHTYLLHSPEITGTQWEVYEPGSNDPPVLYIDDDSASVVYAEVDRLLSGSAPHVRYSFGTVRDERQVEQVKAYLYDHTTVERVVESSGDVTGLLVLLATRVHRSPGGSDAQEIREAEWLRQYQCGRLASGLFGFKPAPDCFQP